MKFPSFYLLPACGRAVPIDYLSVIESRAFRFHAMVLTLVMNASLFAGTTATRESLILSPEQKLLHLKNYINLLYKN